MPHASPLRVFFAVELPDETRQRVARYVEDLRGRAPQVRASWERAEKLHLTLKFIGEVEAERVEGLKLAAGRAGSGVAPFDISIAGTGAFPPRGAPRVLWLGVLDEGGRLAELQRRLETECAAEGFPREQRAFRPHLTLARLRAPQGAAQLSTLHTRSDFGPETFTVGELVLVRSELAPGGSRHTPLSRHTLAAV
jgi:2'-5' RNA ligase